MSRRIRRLTLPLLLWSAFAAAAPGKGPRSEKRFGVAVGGIADPYPALLGGLVKVNAFEFLRVSAGYGSALASGLTLTTWGAGVDLLVPRWKISPMAGLHFASIRASADFTIRDSTVSAAGSLFVVYATFGLDYQSAKGWNVGAGYTVPFGATFKGLGLPYVYAGKFF